MTEFHWNRPIPNIAQARIDTFLESFSTHGIRAEDLHSLFTAHQKYQKGKSLLFHKDTLPKVLDLLDCPLGGKAVRLATQLIKNSKISGPIDACIQKAYLALLTKERSLSRHDHNEANTTLVTYGIRPLIYALENGHRGPDIPRAGVLFYHVKEGAGFEKWLKARRLGHDHLHWAFGKMEHTGASHPTDDQIAELAASKRDAQMGADTAWALGFRPQNSPTGRFYRASSVAKQDSVWLKNLAKAHAQGELDDDQLDLALMSAYPEGVKKANLGITARPANKTTK